MMKTGSSNNSAVWALLVVLIVSGFAAFAISLGRVQRQANYLCSTTSVLDDVVVDAASQIQKNFNNGTYARLLRQKIITQDNVDAAAATLSSYTKAHFRLSTSKVCSQ